MSVTSSVGSIITVHNPGTGELLGEVEAATAEQVAAVVARAQEGQRAMAALAAHERADLLRRVSDLIEAEQESLALLLAAENGKPLPQTRGEVAAAIRIFRGTRARPPGSSAGRSRSTPYRAWNATSR